MALYTAVSVLSFFPVFVLYLAVAVQVLPTRQQLLRISQSFFQFPPIQSFFLRSWLEAQRLSVGSTGEADWENVQVCLSSSDRTASSALIYLPRKYPFPGKLNEQDALP
ncbi:hypothetical protein AMECASPLE_021862 [Ameca splendens]|uniref:Uncharacterized protein n=1 Tax=Ameca splendens TaxID=208324 RepID=A0ABV1ABN7_9TELE